MITLRVISREALRMVKARCPVDTRNLIDHGINLVYKSKTSSEITIGGAKAPYAVYTNEKWVAPRWKGAHNPNENWIDKSVDDIVQRIVIMTGGRLEMTKGKDERLANKKFWESKEGIALRDKYELPKFKFTKGES